MENKVLTQEELQSLQSLQDKRNQLSSEFGIIEMQLQDLKMQKDTLLQSLNDLRQEEYRLSNEMQNKYGRVQVNLSNGEVTPLD